MRKLTRPVQKVNAQVIGLDVHKQCIFFCRLDRRGEEVSSGRFAATREGLEEFLKGEVGRKKTHFAFEASGYTLWVYDLLVARYDAEVVHVAQAKKIRAIANSRQKNDANDAFWLAYLTYESRLPEAWIPQGVHRELRLATRARIHAVRRRSRLVTILRSHLAQVGERVSSSLATVRGWARAVELVGRVDGARGDVLQECLEEIERYDRRIAAWEGRIAGLVEELPAVAAIEREIPGLGRVLAAAVYAETGPLERFARAKSFGGFTGLPPTDRSSGGRMRHGGISREGSPYLRWALTQAVMACLRAKRGPGFAVGEWVRRREKRMQAKGKARCAAARKLAESIWRLFHYGECFDAARAFAS
ncbi:MAG: IS110 family RNA-guided transposase [Planctomycetota bacterium]|jgi:transposase